MASPRYADTGACVRVDRRTAVPPRHLFKEHRGALSCQHNRQTDRDTVSKQYSVFSGEKDTRAPSLVTLLDTLWNTGPMAIRLFHSTVASSFIFGGAV